VIRTRLLFALCLIAAPLSLHAEAHDTAALDRESDEYRFVACVHEKDRSLLYAMRDADGPKGFEAAAKEAFGLCEMAPSESFSMKRLFDAIASFIGKPEYEDAGSKR
jgi:hypothetical protein